LCSRTIEGNLNSFIRAPQIHLDELATFVHRPVFKHVQYEAASYDNTVSPSNNVAALEAVLATMNIENDPWIQSMREQLGNLPHGLDRTRVDQKLSKAISKGNTCTHKGLKDFARAASEICADVGIWAADWYVEKVLEQAKTASTPHQIISELQNKEKMYLLEILAQVQIIPVSYQPEAILAGISDKTRVLIECLQAEKASTETHGEDYSGIIFVTRRDAVLALTEVLSHHPRTENTFRIGCLLGSSDGAYRRAFPDITRIILAQTQAEVLLDFKVREKNLIVSTSVAEEGIDIQACGSVIRWDIPMNMTSWAQSRGRARRERSTFILMFDNLHVYDGLVSKWERLEKEMQASYNNTRRQKRLDEESASDEDGEYLEFGVESTG
jgi:endoribonuclease Dicer